MPAHRALLEAMRPHLPSPFPSFPLSASAGEAERAAALQAAEAHSAAVGGLLDDVQQLQQRAEEVRLWGLFTWWGLAPGLLPA